MPRKPKPPDEGLLPAGKSRAELLARHYAPIEAALQRGDRDTVRRGIDRLSSHPDATAVDVIEQHLQAAHLHPALAQSPELSRFVFLMRELLADAVPGMTMEQIMEPWPLIVAQAAGARGGRPPSEFAAEWCGLVEVEQQKNPRLSVDDACRRVAAEWRDKNGKPRSFGRIRNAVRAERKSPGNPVSE